MLSKSLSLTLLISVLILLITETLCGTYWMQTGDMNVVSIVYVVSGALLAFLPLVKIQINTPSVSPTFFKVFQSAHWLIWLFVALWCIPTVNRYFTEVPIFYQNADMVPVLKIQAQRFLKSEDVYTVIPEIWDGMKPIYLTFLWLPFTISEYFGFDARWIVMGGIAFGLFFMFRIFQRSRISVFSGFAIVGIFTILNYLIRHDKSFICFTEEGVVVGYYLFLAYALSRKNAWLIGLGIAFCVLSRYLLVFWLPVFWLYWFFFQSRKEAGIILSVSGGLVLTTFLIPYGFKNINFFLGQHNGYIDMAKSTWINKPNFTNESLGLAKFFKVENIEFLHTLLVSFAILTPLVFGVLFLILRSKKWIQPELFALCSLKLSMVCFYNLLEMPYSYLFYTNTFFSYALVFHYFTHIETTPVTAILDAEPHAQRLNSLLQITTMKIKSSYLVLGLSVLFFLLKFGINVLDVTHTNWVYKLSFDPGTEMISWNYFRHTPWSFPIIGRLEGYDYPTITGSGMTGIVSPLALIFKIFSKWLPADFQYFGWWFLLSFILQGYFGLKLIKNMGKKYQLNVSSYFYPLAVAFFLAAPPLLFRFGHIHMFSHFFILAALAYYFENDKTPLRKFIYFTLLSGLCIGVSQYTTVMVMGIALASFLDMAHRRLMPFYLVFLYGLGVLVPVLGVYYLLGGFLMPFSASQSVGFGQYASNLNTFFNPLDTSKILSGLALSNNGQYEGYGYLGLGFLLMCLFVLAYKLFNKTTETIPNAQSPHLYPLFAMAFLFFFYALSCKIGWYGSVIYEWRYGPIGAMLFESLRASGRFIWMPFYVVMVFGLVAFLKIKMPNAIKTGLLLGFLALQLVDIQKLLTLDAPIFKKSDAHDYPHTKWKPIMAEAERVVIFPLYAWNIKDDNDFFLFARAASEMQKGITTGYYARRNMPLIKDYERATYRDWANGDLGDNKNAIFIGKKDKMWRFKTLAEQGKVQSFDYDGYAILVPLTLPKTIEYLKKLPNCQHLPFYTEGVADFIKKHANNTIFITASEEATYQLDSTTRAAFDNTGAKDFSKLGFAGAYMSVIHKGKTVFEAVNNEKTLGKTWKTDELLRGAKNFTLASGGAYMGKMSKIIIDGKDYSPNKRGLNFVVVNDKFEVIDTTYFDTYEETSHTIFK